MPIRKENRRRYPKPKEWQRIRIDILTRASYQCDFCKQPHGVFKGESFIRLQVAHLDQQPENNHYSNLAALCPKCHLKYDEPFRMEHRKVTLFWKRHIKFNLDLFHMQEVFMTQELIRALQGLLDSDKPDQEGVFFLTNEENRDDYIEHIVNLADEILILNSKPNYKVMDEVERAVKCKIGPGERDSFGWLTGVISTRKGKIVYG